VRLVVASAVVVGSSVVDGGGFAREEGGGGAEEEVAFPDFVAEDLGLPRRLRGFLGPERDRPGLTRSPSKRLPALSLACVKFVSSLLTVTPFTFSTEHSAGRQFLRGSLAFLWLARAGGRFVLCKGDLTDSRPGDSWWMGEFTGW
jgi:hypothetical protein